MHALGGEHRPSHMPTKIEKMIAHLEVDSWYQVRQTGSHYQFHHAAKIETVTVAGKLIVELPPGIFKQAGLKK